MQTPTKTRPPIPGRDAGRKSGDPAVLDPSTIDDEDGRTAHQEDLLDQGVEETFPASDPVSVKRIT